MVDEVEWVIEHCNPRLDALSQRYGHPRVSKDVVWWPTRTEGYVNLPEISRGMTFSLDTAMQAVRRILPHFAVSAFRLRNIRTNDVIMADIL